MSEKGVLPCLTSQTQSMPSCPPVATMCCWFGCLSTQCRGTLSPDLKWEHWIWISYNRIQVQNAARKEQNRQILLLVLQRENLGWRVALLSEIKQLELADRVHCQNLWCPQVSHGMDRAAVRILWQWSKKHVCHIILRCHPLLTNVLLCVF